MLCTNFFVDKQEREMDHSRNKDMNDVGGTCLGGDLHICNNLQVRKVHLKRGAPALMEAIMLHLCRCMKLSPTLDNLEK